MDYLSIAQLIGISYYVLLITLIITQSSNDLLAKYLLAALLVTLTSTLLFQLISRSDLYYSTPIPILISLYFLLLLKGPILLAYARRATLQVNPFGQRYWWAHLIPALLGVLLLSFYFSGTWEEITDFIVTPQTLIIVTSILADILILIYSVLSVKSVSGYHKRILDHYSDEVQYSLKWFFRLTMCICIGLVSTSLVELSFIIYGSRPEQLVESVFVLLTLFHLFIIFLAFDGLGHSYSLEIGNKPEIRKYANSSLRKDSALYIRGKLQTLMAEQCVFLESNLTLNSLARKLATNPHYLSQVLNEEMGENFYDYVNKLRMQFAKEKLENSDNTTPIIEIAYECGYNSKSSFYNSFRKYTGLTPSQYRRAYVQRQVPRIPAN